MRQETTWTKRYKLGNVDGKGIYLSAPSWDCGWYWGFGYLGNSDCHYHLDGIAKNQSLFDALLEHFDGNTHIFKHEPLTWRFCELVRTAYKLKDTAEVLGRGGSHYTTNPLSEMIKNPNEAERINNVLLPAIFDEIEKTILALKKHGEFLKSKDGMFVLTDGHYNLSTEIMSYDQIVDFMKQRVSQGFNTEKDTICKIKKGELRKNSKGEDLVELYNVETGVCSVLLCNKQYNDKVNAALEQQIFEYRKD